MKEHQGVVLFDFSRPADLAGWHSVDDVVMGGCSSGTCSVEGDHLLFSGILSLAHGGGFSSIRSPFESWDLDGTDTILLRVRGDGRAYKFGLRTSAAFDAVLYQTRFLPLNGYWSDIPVPIQDLLPVFHGQPVLEAPPVNLAAIRNFSILIGDRQEGKFSLGIARISALYPAVRGNGT